MLIVNGDSTVRDILMKHATFDDISADKSLTATEYTQGEFWELSMKAAGALTRLGAGRGDRVLHVFSGEMRWRRRPVTIVRQSNTIPCRISSAVAGLLCSGSNPQELPRLEDPCAWWARPGRIEAGERCCPVELLVTSLRCASTGNRVEDLAFRLGGTCLGTVPVTVK
jgi:hypothetical protein